MYKQLFEWKKKPQFCLILILFGKVYRFISFLHKSLKGEMGTLLWKCLCFWTVGVMTFQGTGLNRWPKNTSWEFFEANRSRITEASAQASHLKGLQFEMLFLGPTMELSRWRLQVRWNLWRANYLWQSVILWKNLGLGLIQTQPSGLPSFKSLHFPSQV